jgi:hypothetical protein
MKPIKCMLLLAAVLSLAAMNAADRAEFFASMNRRADESTGDPKNYVDDVDSRRSCGFMEFEKCVCCNALSYRRQSLWLANNPYSRVLCAKGFVFVSWYLMATLPPKQFIFMLKGRWVAR